MSSKNTKVKKKLIELYGPECFIEKLHLRPPETYPKRYKSKGQLKRMKALSYHHIKERSKGGPTTIENGALLSTENHEWFNKQPPEVQAALNKKFKEYKECKVVYSDDVQVDFEIKCTSFQIDDRLKEKQKYNRAKAKRELERRIDEEYEWDDDRL